MVILSSVVVRVREPSFFSLIHVHYREVLFTQTDGVPNIEFSKQKTTVWNTLVLDIDKICQYQDGKAYPLTACHNAPRSSPTAAPPAHRPQWQNTGCGKLQTLPQALSSQRIVLEISFVVQQFFPPYFSVTVTP